MENIENEFKKLICDSVENDTLMHYQLKTIIRSYIIKKKCQHVIWNLLHLFSVLYPENPTNVQKENTKTLLLKIKSYMPYCSTCSNNGLDNFVENANLETIVNNKSELVKFLIEYHKFVNINLTKVKNYNESIYNIDFIYNKYSDGLYEKYFTEKYDISFFDIINVTENFDLSFRQELSKLSVNIIKEINNTEYNIIELKINIT
jgi:hypothetical protein